MRRCGHAPLREQPLGAHEDTGASMHGEGFSSGMGRRAPCSSLWPSAASEGLLKVYSTRPPQTSFGGHSTIRSLLVRRRRSPAFFPPVRRQTTARYVPRCPSNRSRGFAVAEGLEEHVCGFWQKSGWFLHNIVTGRPVSVCPLPVLPRLSGNCFVEFEGEPSWLIPASATAS